MFFRCQREGLGLAQAPAVPRDGGARLAGSSTAHPDMHRSLEVLPQMIFFVPVS